MERTPIFSTVRKLEGPVTDPEGTLRVGADIVRWTR
jgi:hypothetical protein